MTDLTSLQSDPFGLVDPLAHNSLIIWLIGPQAQYFDRPLALYLDPLNLDANIFFINSNPHFQSQYRRRHV